MSLLKPMMVLGAIASLALPGVLSAHGKDWKKNMEAHRAAFQKACGADIESYCKTAGKDVADKHEAHKAVFTCLEAHATDQAKPLHGDCVTQVQKGQKMKAKMEAIKTACAADIAKCDNQEHFMHCLFKAKKKSKLSAQCQSALPTKHEGWGEEGK